MAVVLCVLMGTAGTICGQTQVTSETEDLVLREGLNIDGIGRYGRSPVYQDALAALLISGTWTSPQEGETLTDATGEERTWQKVEADEEGWFQAQRRQRSGYIYVPVHSDAERTMVLRPACTRVVVAGRPSAPARQRDVAGGSTLTGRNLGCTDVVVVAAHE